MTHHRFDWFCISPDDRGLSCCRFDIDSVLANILAVRETLILALVFLVAGLLNFARPLWVYLQALQTVYVVTSHRVMIIRANGSIFVDSLDPAEIFDLKCGERQDGSGDVMISTNFSVRTRNTLARRRWWVYGVPRAREVEHLVSELKHQRSQALSHAGRFVALDFDSPP